MNNWTDAATGSVELKFDADGQGSLDGKAFTWSGNGDRISVCFMPQCPMGAETELEVCAAGEGLKLKIGDELFITGDAFTADEAAAELGREIAEYACRFVGGEYHYGGKSPETGFDCSGLIYYVYSQFGYDLNRVAADQAKNGVHVEPELLRAGDILCFKSGEYISHAGIYLGDGLFVHAECSDTGIVISELSGRYKDRGFEARRIVSAEEIKNG